jgi:hypothetical protein
LSISRLLLRAKADATEALPRPPGARQTGEAGPMSAYFENSCL